MKKFLPILFGVLLPFTFYLYLVTKERPPLKLPDRDAVNIHVDFGDPNVENLTQDQYYSKMLAEIVKGKTGNYSIYIKNIEDDWVASTGTKYNFYAASLFKIPVAIKVFEHIEADDVSLDDEVIYTTAHYYGGSGKVKELAFGTTLTVDQLLNYLIKDSDNVAQSMLFTIVDKDEIYELMPSPTTVRAVDIISLLEKLYNEEYLGEEDTEKLVALMTKTSFDNRVNAGLVKGVSFSHKIGNWANTGSWHDCGIVTVPKTMFVCVMSKGTSFEDFLFVSEQVGELVSKVSIQ